MCPGPTQGQERPGSGWGLLMGGCVGFIVGTLVFPLSEIEEAI